jgi:hypothetical protein
MLGSQKKKSKNLCYRETKPYTHFFEVSYFALSSRTERQTRQIKNLFIV